MIVLRSCHFCIMPSNRKRVAAAAAANVLATGKHRSVWIRFDTGWIRQLSGANYFISMRQLFESGKKIRAISLLKFSQFTVKDIRDNKILKRSNCKSIAKDAEFIRDKLFFHIYKIAATVRLSTTFLEHALDLWLIKIIAQLAKNFWFQMTLVLDIGIEPEALVEAASFLWRSTEVDYGRQRSMFLNWVFYAGVCFMS